MSDSPKRGRRPVEHVTEPQLRVLSQITDFIASRGLPPTSQELAELLNVSAATIHEQVHQLVRKGYLRREPRKARGLSVLRKPETALTALVAIPILGTVPAGTPMFAAENVLGEIAVDQKLVGNGRCFALRVVGESMRDASINDGDLIIVRQQPVAENGDIVVALLDDEATVKRLSIRAHEIELRPENPDFSPIPIGPEDDLRIIGKVVAVRRPQGG